MLTLPRLLASLRLDREEGQVLPLFAAAIAALLFMTAVVVDGGNLFQNRQSLQNAADAAALAAAVEVGLGHCTLSNSSACGGLAGKYAGLNAANGTDGNSSEPTELDPCPDTVTATQPPADPPGCYVYPYNGDSNKVEVWLRRNTSNFFGTLLGIEKSSLSARAVAAPFYKSNPQTFAYWNRIYADSTALSSNDPNRCDWWIRATMNNPVAAAGSVCLGDADNPGILATWPIELGGNVCVDTDSKGQKCSGGTLPTGRPDSGVGAADAPLDSLQVSIGGGIVVGTGKCAFRNLRTLHVRPCTLLDHIFTTDNHTLEPPQNTELHLPRIQCPDDGCPTDDAYSTLPWTYWRAHAAPGPTHPCTVSSGTVPSFTSTGNVNLTPTTGSYTCISKDAGGEVIGELSWLRNQDAHPNPCSTAVPQIPNCAVSGVLTIKGQIFFMGSWVTPNANENQSVDYHGLGSIFLYSNGNAGAKSLNWAHTQSPNTCAGGDGTYDCQYSADAFAYGPPTVPTSLENHWDPNVNMMTIYTYGNLDLRGNDSGIFGTGGAFMGQIWSRGNCRQEGAPWMRASMNCNTITMVTAQTTGNVPPQYYFQFPSTSTLQPPQEGDILASVSLGE